ncbi:hypothetical protein [Streptomyces sp. NBC_01637]|uniref:hypothetical protein n=1 Tax=unclassified Streptomyces TaxID=2593676 RepID=UPI00386454EF|nr:hypothetical protein OH719_43585 [Streptomyces sp. NBC_01653]WTD86731.1 hypothetical protein OG891_03280 [Streptomyces sp. NBC_01637]
MGEQVVCDTCNTGIDRSHSYCLTTTNVVLSEAYWRSQFRLVTNLAKALDWDERNQAAAFDRLISDVAGSATPWLICGGCSEYFAFDRAAAREHALRGSVPERSGAVEPGGFAQFAAAAWEYVFGRWPATVQQPTVKDTCDFCAKKIYGGEFAGRIEAQAAERHLASGVLDSPPLCPPREGQGGWLSCMVCMNRIVARAERMGGGR